MTPGTAAVPLKLQKASWFLPCLPSQEAAPEACQVKVGLCALSRSLELHLEGSERGTGFASLLKEFLKKEEGEKKIPGRNISAQSNIYLGA